MNQYKSLAVNTVIFAIGTFSSKALAFLLVPIYTRALTSAEYGIVDLIVQTSNLLVPVVTIGITNAIIRFGLDKSYKKDDVFTTGLLAIFMGFVLLLLCQPLLERVSYISEHTILLYTFVLMSSMRQLCSQFTRAKGMIRLYALDGFISTLTTGGLTILFLMGFKWGITGYLLAIILSDACSTILLFIAAGLIRYIRFKGIDYGTTFSMLKYAIPLIPTTVFWWVINVSDRYIVSYLLGSEANGLYAVAYKVPSIVVLVSGIFIEAWQVSAVSETSKAARERFFSNVFQAYQAVIFLAASGLILFAKSITKVLVAAPYYPSWKYIPFLIMATTFSCLVTFLGSIYMVEKRSGMTLLTTVLGAVVNIILNILLIPLFGVNGAAFATFISYFAVFVVRAFNTRRFIKIKWNLPRFFGNTIVIFAQSLIMIIETPNWILYQGILFSMILVMNFNLLIANINKVLEKRKKKQ